MSNFKTYVLDFALKQVNELMDIGGPKTPYDYFYRLRTGTQPSMAKVNPKPITLEPKDAGVTILVEK